jgi:hypothetical protein
MPYLTDMKWLIILPLIPSTFFVIWVFWNLWREIWAEKRRWIRHYRATGDCVYRPESGARSLPVRTINRGSGFRR